MRASRTVGLLLVGLLVAGCSTAAGDVAVRGTSPVPSTSPAPSEPTTSVAPDTAGTAGSPTTAAAGPTTTVPTPVTPLVWQPCGRLQCATLTVPLDYADASKGTIDLNMKRRPASGNDRVGSLLVNPGGPGVAGTTLVDQATLIFSEDLLDHFDIVGWDPRGTGESSPVDCVDDLDPVLALDQVPDTPAKKQVLIDAAKEFDAACQERSGRILPYISTQDSAKDMELIRKALGEEKISYLGFSYGSQLGAMYATLFPTSVRAMVLDGAADPNAGYIQDTKQATAGVERGLQQLMDDCAKRPSCAFYHDGNPMAAYDALMAKLAVDPIPSADSTRPAVGPGIAFYGVVSGLYLKQFWPLVTPRWRRPKRATVRSSWRCTTSTRSAGPTARGATSSRDSSPSTAWMIPGPRICRSWTPTPPS